MIAALWVMLLAGVVFADPQAARNGPPAAPLQNSQQRLVQQYVRALQHWAFEDAFRLLNASERTYYRDQQNFASVYRADAYRIERFSIVAMRVSLYNGSVLYVRETASYRDYEHDRTLRVRATVPIGVVLDHGVWRIKDPGHPWRAFVPRAVAAANGLRVTVKKVSFFTRRIELIVTFANLGDSFATLLPYGRSLLRDRGGVPYRLLQTRDWSLTDRTLFEGLRLAPRAQYTAVLAFASPPLDNAWRSFELRLAPLLLDGADAPFSIDIDRISATALPAAVDR